MVAACWLHTGCGLLTFRVSLLAVHTMDELRMTGNCLRGSRPILSFDSNFDTQPHLKVMKEMFCHVRRAVGCSVSARPAAYVGTLHRRSVLPAGTPRASPSTITSCRSTTWTARSGSDTTRYGGVLTTWCGCA